MFTFNMGTHKWFPARNRSTGAQLLKSVVARFTKRLHDLGVPFDVLL